MNPQKLIKKHILTFKRTTQNELALYSSLRGSLGVDDLSMVNVDALTGIINERLTKNTVTPPKPNSLFSKGTVALFLNKWRPEGLTPILLMVCAAWFLVPSLTGETTGSIGLFISIAVIVGLSGLISRIAFNEWFTKTVVFSWFSSGMIQLFVIPWLGLISLIFLIFYYRSQVILDNSRQASDFLLNELASIRKAEEFNSDSNMIVTLLSDIAEELKDSGNKNSMKLLKNCVKQSLKSDDAQTALFRDIFFIFDIMPLRDAIKRGNFQQLFSVLEFATSAIHKSSYNTRFDHHSQQYISEENHEKTAQMRSIRKNFNAAHDEIVDAKPKLKQLQLYSSELFDIPMQTRKAKLKSILKL